MVISLALIVLAKFISGNSTLDNNNVIEQSTILTPKGQMIEAFSNASYKIRINMKLAIQETMNDPNTFEYVDMQPESYNDEGLLVIMKYRGKNAFGGVVTSYMEALTNKNGDVIKLFNTDK